jgi:cyclophilin family peptidyl-prolyl cis-trans isomerase
MIFAAAAILLAADAQAANPVVVMETSYGTIKIELFEDQAPVTAKNFLDYVDSKHFDGLIFHRVVRKREDGQGIGVIQGGGFMPGMKERKTKDPIKLEAKLSNKRGTICMARTNDPDTATSQFFINVDDNLQLDPDKDKGRDGYAVFGRVIEGMDVVDKIGKVRTASAAGHDDVPVEDIMIKSAKRTTK